MPGGNNRSYELNKPANFTYRFLDIKGLSVRRYLSLVISKLEFSKASCSASFFFFFFLHCQLNTKLQKSFSNAMSQNRQHNVPI